LVKRRVYFIETLRGFGVHNGWCLFCQLFCPLLFAASFAVRYYCDMVSLSLGKKNEGPELIKTKHQRL